jgi:hypothetical protein
MKSDQATRIAAMNVLEKLQTDLIDKESIIESASNNTEKPIEPWILTSWCLEAQLLKNSIEDIKNQFVTDNFNF